MSDSGNVNNECGICLGEWTNPVRLPCGHTFCADCLSGWKPKFGRPKDRQRKRCPLCRATIPPSQEQIARMKWAKLLMKDKCHPDYKHRVQMVKQFEEEYGEDWDGTMIEYDSDFVDLPKYVAVAFGRGNLRAVLQWLGKGKIVERVNAKLDVAGNAGLLHLAVLKKQLDLMSYLLLNGADVNILESRGSSVLTSSCLDRNNPSETVRLLLSWGAEHIVKGERVTKEGKLVLRQEIDAKGNVEISNLISAELGGRRCEIVSAPSTRDDLVGKTCVVDEYIKESDQYKVRMEFTNEELLLGVNNLRRRDRTPQDPGYYVVCKNNRLIRRDFKSNEDCHAFIASLGSDVMKSSDVNPDAEAKAEQAAADLLSELGLGDLEGPSSSSALKMEKEPAGHEVRAGDDVARRAAPVGSSRSSRRRLLGCFDGTADRELGAVLVEGRDQAGRAMGQLAPRRSALPRAVRRRFVLVGVLGRVALAAAAGGGRAIVIVGRGGSVGRSSGSGGLNSAGAGGEGQGRAGPVRRMNAAAFSLGGLGEEERRFRGLGCSHSLCILDSFAVPETEIMNAASAWATGPTRLRSRAGIPSARTASAEEGHRKRCPLCRGVVPPSQEQVANYKMVKKITKDTSGPLYEENARWVKQFEAEYGEDWDGTMIEYDRNFVELPEYVAMALFKGNLRAVLQWLSKGKLKERVNAKCEEGGNAGLLRLAAMNKHQDLMSYLLLNGADVNILSVGGDSVLTPTCFDQANHLEAIRLLLSWGAEHILKGELITKERKLALRQEMSTKGHFEIANIISSELGGRRCEIVSAPKTRDDLVGKTCVAEEYVEISDHYRVTMEFTNEVLRLGANKLKRRDRTPQDPGYYVECKNNRLTRRDFKSNEECRAFVASLREDVEESSRVDPDADAKAEQAAAELLAELGLDDLEGPSSSASKKNNQPAASGKKKKRGGKKKGR
ncbi:hypothetical protein THAOC_04366, partial [Thalassiosira oceanica]